MRKQRKILFLLVGQLLLVTMLLAGCQRAEKNTEIVLTTEFAENEVFRINQASCTVPEVTVYMRTLQDQYENVFGGEIWQKDLGGTNLETQLKDTILARLAQIKVMNLLAEEHSILLTEKEKALVDKAAKEYMSGLSAEEISSMGINLELIRQLYGEYALANKVYSEITKDVNPEISDDEARTIAVKAILIKTYFLDSDGNKVEYTESQRQEARKTANAVLDKAKAGEDFDQLITEYNEDEESSYAFGKGSMPQTFEDAAFNLETDQISELVETEYGYHIIKCVSTFDRDETDANKLKIVEQRKNESFNQVYDEFVQSLYSNLNEELWDSMVFDENAEIKTTNFFDVYNDNFSS